jgi:Asp-tRNA(Asn)/Glu-tRNA(Gln) amidotransferase A subunit family amidase
VLKKLIPVFILIAIAMPSAQAPPPFEVHEATIAQIHSAMKAGRLTCRGLVEMYLKRIDTFDKNGPAINAIVMTNPEATRWISASSRAA